MDRSIIISLISNTLNLRPVNVENTITLLDRGATIPFISRYRKEVTGALNEVQIAEVKSLNDKYVELEKRKRTILASIEEQEKLTPELKERIGNCWDPVALEDIYLPLQTQATDTC